MTTSATRVEIGAAIRLGGVDWTLEGAIQTGADASLAFTAIPKATPSLSRLVQAIYQELSGQELPTASMLPDIGLTSLTFKSFGPGPPPATEPAAFAAQAEIAINRPRSVAPPSPSGPPAFNLRVTVARQAATVAKRGEKIGAKYLAGIETDGPIALVRGGDGVTGRLLGDVAIDRLGLFYASDVITDSRLSGKPQRFPKGPAFAASFRFRTSQLDIQLSQDGLVFDPFEEPTKPAADRAESPDATTPTDAQTNTQSLSGLRYWIDLGKTFGPLQLRRIGGEWDAGKIGILLDAAIELAGLTVTLAGLKVRVNPAKLTTLTFSDLEFGLEGMGLDFQRGPIAIGGMLLKTPTGSYSGMASIRAATWSIGAIGSYGTTEAGTASFFIFGAFKGLLGGPPCFVVMGIAAGFGYNRAIVLPDIENVPSFPLVNLVMDAPKTVAQDYDRTFPPIDGQYWIAAGVYFSSFKLIETFALLTVQFGTRFELALLGVATLRQPPKEVATTVRPLVYVEMAIKVRFAPDDGVLSVMAVLTAKSFLFDPSCRLTGGFAFYVWFKPSPHAGDFVLTLGGYHPKFPVPAHYPKVPRVGFDWQLPDYGVAITGEAYFALTPSYIMAGGRLSAVFRAGDFAAWFEAYANFLIGWAPLHYEADMGVRIGASYVLRVGSLAWSLSFEIGATLRIWGPPFAGEAYINLGIIAFTVPIGDRSALQGPKELTWPEFKTAFLPPAPLTATITGGLIREHTGTDATKAAIVNPSELCIAVDSFIPITTTAAFGLPPTADDRIGIRPMGKGRLVSSLAGELVSLVSRMPQRPPVALQEPSLPIRKSVPKALWSRDLMPDPRMVAMLPETESQPIPGVLTGIEVRPRNPDETNAIDYIKQKADETIRLSEWPSRQCNYDAYYDKPDCRDVDVPRERPRYRQTALEQYRTNFKPERAPNPQVLDLLRGLGGFDLPDTAVDLSHLRHALRDKAANPIGIWRALPVLTRIERLSPVPQAT